MAQKKIIRSIKGSEVDFDLMKVKQNMLQRDKPNGVEVREQYIDIRRRRNPRRNVADLEREQQANVADAREKIQQSKKTREADEKTASEIKEIVEGTPAEVDSTPAVITATDIVETPSATEEPKKAVKKIVKKTD